MMLAVLTTMAQVNTGIVTDIYDIRPGISPAEKVNAFVYWLRNKQITSYNEVKAFCINRGFEIDSLLLAFKFPANQQGWIDLGQEMDLFVLNDYEYKSRFEKFVKSINAKVNSYFKSSFEEQSGIRYCVMQTQYPNQFVFIVKAGANSNHSFHITNMPAGITEKSSVFFSRNTNYAHGRYVTVRPADKLVQSTFIRADSLAFNFQVYAGETNTSALVHVDGMPVAKIPDPVFTAQEYMLDKVAAVHLSYILRAGLMGVVYPGGYEVSGSGNLALLVKNDTRYELHTRNQGKIISTVVNVSAGKVSSQ